ncbi:FtsB family cell division protein [Nocardioides bizhenqiangii]|uniref:Septum formation initiator family protein n=1 Tax=Nocardioides bizhenqiangii TaxID=3095076 RepID=A0ABZ0ZU25_9ACTN|nr:MULTISPECIES: septum formation initiator family protein [unclassified Nocardioides]MDZ5623600.1 septum formation initiator family protein [Nocardioides sp. HM23]WQQ27823.1 septum formation initiator family protein [Nocardioides sp. HM61]
MAATPGDRRTPAKRSGRPSRPARSGPGAAGRPERKRAERDRAATVARVRADERHRSRLTGRAAILVLVLAVLAVSYASSLRAYLQQRHQIDDLETLIEEKESAIDELQRETDRRKDPAFVMQEARKLGYVLPGETPFVVVDANGDPLTDAELDDPSSSGDDEAPAWYDGVWSSVKVAGDPPTEIPPPPQKRIVGSED